MAFRLQLLVALIGGAAAAGHKANWSAVCDLETARAVAEKAARTSSRAVRAALPRTPTLRLSVEGGPSNDGVPLTVPAGKVVHATYVGGGKRHLTTAISVDGVPSCPGTGHESTVAVEMSVPTTRSLRKRGHHHRHRFKRHTSHEHESKYSTLRPSERVVIDAVLCDGRKKIAKQRAVTRVVEAKSLGLCRSSVPSPRKPPRANPRALLALLEGRKSEARSLLSNAAETLVRRLERRGVLCDKTRLCDARVLPSCPAGCRVRDANASCVFAHLVVENKKELEHLPKTCVEVCFSKLAIKYVWRADVSRGGDERDKLALERCRILHIHKLAAWFQEHRSAAPFQAASEGKRSVPVPAAQSLDRCAVVGSGHALRCGSPWGGTIDSYDAVFRVNKVQLQTENRNAYSCKVGARVDFAINALTVGQFEELVNNSIAEKFLAQHVEVLDSLSGLGLCGNQAVNFVIVETFRNLQAIEAPLRGRRRVDGVESPRHRADAVTGTTSRRWRGASEI